jgi:glycerol-3-phosphate dehydrogenase (NAD(P)+)
MPLERIAVVGAGAWGTALAQAAARAGRTVTLIGRDAAVAAEVNRQHTNSSHLGDIQLLPAIEATIAPEAAEPADLVILAVPAQASRLALGWIGPARLAEKPVVLSAKGLEHTSLSRQSEILAELAPGATPFVLSGPSFAADVAAGRPTAVTLAGEQQQPTFEVATALASPSFRPYASGDLVGVELAGALKNVYALACGAVEGAGLGASARAALLARAYAEMARIVGGLGGDPGTLTGLAGLGDLTLTCTTPQSRNYRFGIGLGQGRRAAEIEAGSGLAEGVFTAPVARRLALRLGVEAPLIEAVCALLEGSADIATIVAGLMNRPLKKES